MVEAAKVSPVSEPRAPSGLSRGIRLIFITADPLPEADPSPYTALVTLHRSDISGIPTMMMRGGTSKGLFFLAEDLPQDPAERDALLLRLMGSPDPRQIDGLGGAHPLTSKVAIVSLSTDTSPDTGTDIDYLFLQISVDQAMVSDRQNCGNIVAAVAPFALERGLIPHPELAPAAIHIRHQDGARTQSGGQGDTATVRIRLLNTGGRAVATVPIEFDVDGGATVRYHGGTSISGVPNTAAAIHLDFDDTMGSSCGSLFPSGNVRDEIDGVPVTMIDNGMPVVILTAASVGISGTESPDDLTNDAELRARLESIRLQAGQLMNLGDVQSTTIPKMTMVSTPTGTTRNDAALNTRTFIPHRCHDAIGVLGAVSVATAIQIKGTVAQQTAAQQMAAREAAVDGEDPDVITIEHPTGTFDATVRILSNGDGPDDSLTDVVIERSGIVRTARKLMDGVAFPYQSEHGP